MDIFGNSQPPAWLQDRAARNAAAGSGALGAVAGTLTGGFVNSFKRDENAPVDPETGEKPRQGFMAGLTEARMNQQDPMWKLKVEQIKTGILHQTAQMETAHALALERQEELKAWMIDAPNLSPWLTSTPEKRLETPPPVARSQKGMQLIGQVGLADQRYSIQKENSKVALGREAVKTEFESAKLEMDPATGIAYDQLVKNGEAYAVGPDGKYTDYPSQKAINLLNQQRIGEKLPIGASEAMRKDFEATKAREGAATIAEARDQAAMERRILQDDAAMKRLQVNIAAKEKENKDKTTPQFVDLGGGDFGVYMPDRGGITVLRDRSKAIALQTATINYKHALKMMEDAQTNRRPDKEKAVIQKTIDEAKKSIEALTIQSAPPGLTNPTPSTNNQGVVPQSKPQKVGRFLVTPVAPG